MIITKLVVQNIGLFKGTHVFDLRPCQDKGAKKPIVLIGGKNGAGKTTLFQAIRLCLYGNNISSFKRRKRDYDHYIGGIFHRVSGSSLQLDKASVQLEFEYSHLGQLDVYGVERSWKRLGASIDESLTVMKNGNEILDLDPSQWQEFIDELIPPGISQLFFFDGEKIKRLADHENDDIQLKDSLRALLGLNLVEQLRADLGIYCTRQSRALRDTENADDGAELKEEEREIDEHLERTRQELAQEQALHDQIMGQIERFEAKIAREGGGFAKDRMQRKFEMKQLDRDVETERNKIRDLCASLLPFALTAKYCRRLEERLLREEQYLQYQNARRPFDNLITELNKQVESASFWENLNVTEQSRLEVSRRLARIIAEQRVHLDEFRDHAPIHQLAPREQQAIMAWIHQALNDVPHQLAESTRKLEEYTRQRRQAESLYNRSPEDDVLSPLMQELKELSHELGLTEEHIRSYAEEIRKSEMQLAECKRNLDARAKKQYNHDVQSHRVSLANDVQDVLDDYVAELQQAKAEELSTLLFQCFTKLSRKGNTIERIEIAPDDLAVTIYEKGGSITPKTELSVGEKQIYAIALLWALTIASRRPLPFIIDTPLGRLDSDHRRNLVTEFFPKASHQMIVFSTDTEINEIYFGKLKANISRSYHLSFDSVESKTIVDEGYFWDSSKECSDA